MKKKLRLKTFRKNIIQLLIFLGIIIVFGFEYCNWYNQWEKTVLTSNHRLHIIKPIEIVGNTKIPAEAQHNKNRNAKHPLFYSK